MIPAKGWQFRGGVNLDVAFFERCLYLGGRQFGIQDSILHQSLLKSDGAMRDRLHNVVIVFGRG